MTARTSFRFFNGHIQADAPEPIAHLCVAEGEIQAFDSNIAGENIDLEGGFLLPGFIDTQVNGGGGVLFNDAPTPEGVAAIGEAHANYGTTGFLPTLISDRVDVIDRAMRAVEAAIDAQIPGVLGIHVEGPFISPARKGIHNADLFRTLDSDTKSLLCSLRSGRTVVTLAPELCTVSDIAELTAAGVIVAAGHTDASYDVMRAALGAGVRGFTHLYNAMSPLTHRAPGSVGAALEDTASYCGLILDDFHVHAAAARIALRCKGADRLMLVTDAMPPVGSASPAFRLGASMITVNNGRLTGPDGTLAGSALTMEQAVRNAVSMLKIDVPTASRMASGTPAAFLGLTDVTGALKPGLRADLVWLTPDLHLRGVWRAGVRRDPDPMNSATEPAFQQKR